MPPEFACRDGQLLTPPPAPPILPQLMSAELSKTYEPSAVQQETNRVWLEEHCFHAEPTDPGDPYAIVIPPPNVTAALHLGHALNGTVQDILTRYHRMRGDNTVWLPGTDHAGISTQGVVDKRLQLEGKAALKDYKKMEAAGQNGREQFIGKVQEWKDEYEKTIIGQLKAMGCSCDWDRLAFTMDEPRAKAVREAFFRLFKDGLIYRGKRLVNWDPVSQTALADDEVEMEEVDGQFYYLRYPVVDTESALPPPPGEGGGEGAQQSNARSPAEHPATSNAPSPQPSPEGRGSHALTFVTVATTRPETMLGDTAVAINPKDPRAAALRGKFVKLPITNRIIPIVEDDYVVLPVSLGGDPEDSKAQFATGFLKVTPAHDPNDYEIGRRHNLAAINVMAPDASISDKYGWTDVGDAGFLLGKSREEARKLIVKWFKEQGLLEEMKPYKHAVGHSYRTHVPVEPYLSDQWYCKVTDDRLAGAALRAMAPDQRTTPGETSNALPLPPGEGGGEGAQKSNARSPAEHPATSNAPSPQPSPGGRGSQGEGQLRFYPSRYAKTFQTWHENIRDWCISRQLWWGHRIPVWRFTNDDAVDSKTDEQLAPLIEQLIRLKNDGRVALRHGERQSEAAPIDLQHTFVCVREEDDRPALELLNQLGFTQDPDVLDTWFSSGLWPLSTLNWPDESQISNLKSALNTWNPSDVLVTAREIITLWVSRMVMFNCYLRGCLPYKDVFIHAMIQDGEGQKMSKTLGNGVDPLDIIESHGADAMRYTLAAMTTHTQDLRMPVDMVDPHSGMTFKPEMITISGGFVVAAPIQSSPKDPTKKMVSTYGMTSGKAKPTPETPLAKNTSSKFDLGRNFCNKIWNAAKFVLSSLEQASPPLPLPPGEGGGEGGQQKNARSPAEHSATPSAPSPQPSPGGRGGQALSLVDRWILSRFNRTIAECDAALAEYRFDNYAKACYDFFWRDLCDWYVEASKPAMKDAARSGQTAEILAALLDGALRLMHPIIPFITETIWWKLNEVRPQRGLPGSLECPPSKRLVKAAWPKAGVPSDEVEQAFTKIQELISAIRQIRNDRQVNPKQVVSVRIQSPPEQKQAIESTREVIESLAVCTLAEVAEKVTPPANAARAMIGAFEVFVEGLVDPDAEKARAGKRREELIKQIGAMKGRLSNEAYIGKAPPHLVQQTRDQLAAAEAELAKLEN
jgi:valyl-tRNA synthetase